jgi:hypothetical protein
VRGAGRELALTVLLAGGPLALSAGADDARQPQPPTETLIGPRAEVVRPDRVEPGHSYQLEITGKNFMIGMTITFGDIQTIAPPYIVSPTNATVEIIVPPVAPLGVRPAVVTSPEGSNIGPGGVLVWVEEAPPAATPEGSPTPAPKKKKRRKPTPVPTPTPGV